MFENQTTDGTSTVVAELSSEIDATLLARNQDRDECEEKRLKPDFIG